MVVDDGNKAVRFSERDMKVFRYHLPRFRLTTNEVLRRLFGVSSVNTVNKWLSRRRDQGYLTATRLTGDAAVDFHQVTTKAVEQFGLDENAAEPFRGQTLPRFYGMLSFCWQGMRLGVGECLSVNIAAVPDVKDGDHLTAVVYLVDDR